MTSYQKAALAASLLMLLSATAYTLAPEGSAGVAATAAPVAPSMGEKQASIRARTVRTVPATHEERLARLKAILAIPQPNVRSAELIAYIDSLPASLNSETVDALIPPGHRRFSDEAMEALSYIFSNWARVDPLAAMAFLKSRPGTLPSRAEDELVHSWAASDLAAASAWYLAQPSTERQSSWLLAILEGGMVDSPEETLKIAASLSDPLGGGSALGALGNLAARHPEIQARLFAAASPEQLPLIVGALASKDEARGIELLKQYPQAMPYTDLGNVYACWADTDFEGAKASIAALPPEPFRQEAVRGMIQRAPYLDPPKALEIMQLYSEAVTDVQRRDFVTVAGRTDPELALSQIPGLADESERDFLTATQLNAWLTKDSATAGKWLAAHPQPAAVLDRLSFPN